MNLAERQEQLRSIAVINLKKSPGGHTAEERKVWVVARQDKSYLFRQFALYEPNLTICCGSTTSACFHQVVLGGQSFDLRRTKRGIPYYLLSPGRHVIEYSHPQARVQANLLYYGRVDAIREILLDAG